MTQYETAVQQGSWGRADQIRTETIEGLVAAHNLAQQVGHGDIAVEINRELARTGSQSKVNRPLDILGTAIFSNAKGEIVKINPQLDRAIPETRQAIMA